ncbi:MAG: ABC transporter permease, partial [Pseudomonadota bacterium]
MEPLGWAGIILGIFVQFLPVWIALALIFAVSIWYKGQLGLYGKLFNSNVGMIGLGIVFFWILTAVMADWVAGYDPLAQISGMKNKFPGTPLPDGSGYYLLGGDNLARDVFSRVVYGSRTVLQIAPAAAVFAFMVGIMLGLPAGYYYGGWLDTGLSFLANMVLAFPVILLFFLLVTPEIQETGLTTVLAAVLFIFPIIFVSVMLRTKYFTQREKLMIYLGITLSVGLFAYVHLTGLWTPTGIWMDANTLNIFVSAVFVNSPTIFRIVRGLAIDIKTRDYVAAAQTRGEGPWYIMLWEILPNARGPLIVDFCLRIGYTTILLGTLGFFGLGLESESPYVTFTSADYSHPA